MKLRRDQCGASAETAQGKSVDGIQNSCHSGQMSDPTAPNLQTVGTVSPPTDWNAVDAQLAASNAALALQKVAADAQVDFPTLHAAFLHLKAGNRIALLGDALPLYRDAKQIAVDAAPLVEAVKQNHGTKAFWFLVASPILARISHLTAPAGTPVWIHLMWPVVAGVFAIVSPFLQKLGNSTPTK